MSKDKSVEFLCISCETKHTTWMTGALRWFCPQCRIMLSIVSDAEAAQMIEMFDAMPLVEKDHRGKGKEMRMLAKPKVDPEAVAAGVRAMIDHKVAPVQDFEKPITYVTCKNGLFEVRHSDLATIITKPKEVLGILEEGTEGITLNLPKIPFEFLSKTISFFRGVCEREKGSSEALVQIWWDRQDKQHTLHVPEQRVSGGGVHHES